MGPLPAGTDPKIFVGRLAHRQAAFRPGPTLTARQLGRSSTSTRAGCDVRVWSGHPDQKPSPKADAVPSESSGWSWRICPGPTFLCHLIGIDRHRRRSWVGLSLVPLRLSGRCRKRALPPSRAPQFRRHRSWFTRLIGKHDARATERLIRRRLLRSSARRDTPRSRGPRSRAASSPMWRAQGQNRS